MFVFDRQSIFVGSMNFDQRSMHLNTEIGLLIDSPELAEELARRFAAMAQPANATRYDGKQSGKGRHLIWRTLRRRDGRPAKEPGGRMAEIEPGSFPAADEPERGSLLERFLAIRGSAVRYRSSRGKVRR
jgi:phosphatidylserine/phosphatidylglycerophosphate/cardiolipin synthase-like enzyme